MRPWRRQRRPKIRGKMKQPPKSVLPVIRAQYFLYFGVLGIYLPFFNLYCYHIGFSGGQIGALSACRSLVMVIFSLVWGKLADRFQTRKLIFIGCSFLSVIVWSLYLQTVDFWPMLVITIGFTVFYAPIIAFLEAFTMDALAHQKKSYGRIRAWGSFSFIAIVILLGPLIDLFDIRLILYLVLTGSLMQAFGGLMLPRAMSRRLITFQRPARRLMAPPVVLFFICGFLMLVSHGAYYGFFSIHLENLGYSKAFIGLAWALASAAEIIVMIQSERLFKRFSLERVLLLAFGVAAFRWIILYLFRSPLPILFSQGLHAVTYGAFHIASILYIDREAPQGEKTFGQAANNAVQYGLGLMTGFFLNGVLYEYGGSRPLFLYSAVIALVAGGLFWGGTAAVMGSGSKRSIS